MSAQASEESELFVLRRTVGRVRSRATAISLLSEAERWAVPFSLGAFAVGSAAFLLAHAEVMVGLSAVGLTFALAIAGVRIYRTPTQLDPRLEIALGTNGVLASGLDLAERPGWMTQSWHRMAVMDACRVAAELDVARRLPLPRAHRTGVLLALLIGLGLTGLMGGLGAVPPSVGYGGLLPLAARLREVGPKRLLSQTVADNQESVRAAVPERAGSEARENRPGITGPGPSGSERSTRLEEALQKRSLALREAATPAAQALAEDLEHFAPQSQAGMSDGRAADSLEESELSPAERRELQDALSAYEQGAAQSPNPDLEGLDRALSELREALESGSAAEQQRARDHAQQQLSSLAQMRRSEPSDPAQKQSEARHSYEQARRQAEGAADQAAREESFAAQAQGKAAESSADQTKAGEPAPGQGTGTDGGGASGEIERAQARALQLSGQDSGAGQSDEQTIEAAARGGFRSPAYERLYRAYHHAQEGESRGEKIPYGHQLRIERYFQLIQPRSGAGPTHE
jgi:hypothetical protein